MTRQIIYSFYTLFLPYRLAIGVFCCVWISLTVCFAQSENETYQQVKLEILCKTIRFIVSENNNPKQADSIQCQSLNSILLNIPPESSQALKIYNIFKTKNYTSFGKNKVEERLDKLIKDIHTELSKLNKDEEWNQQVQILHIQLTETKSEILQQIRDGNYLKDTIKTPQNQPITTQNSKTQSSDSMYIYLILVFLLSAVGIGYLFWQNQELKKQILDLEDFMQERYSRVDNRLDMMTSIKDYHALLLKFNFLNEQVNALIQEVMVLKTRNELKISPQELYAKRTEHLEKQAFNPEVQIYYGKYRPDKQGFDPQDFRTEPSRDSIYKIEINLKDTEQAIYSIVDRSEFHHIALVNAPLMLAPACDYANEPYNDSRIINIESGVLEKKDTKWAITKKAKISFE